MVNRTPYRSAHAQTCSVTDAAMDTEGTNSDGIILPGAKGTYVVADPGRGRQGVRHLWVNILLQCRQPGYTEFVASFHVALTRHRVVIPPSPLTLGILTQQAWH